MDIKEEENRFVTSEQHLSHSGKKSFRAVAPDDQREIFMRTGKRGRRSTTNALMMLSISISLVKDSAVKAWEKRGGGGNHQPETKKVRKTERPRKEGGGKMGAQGFFSVQDAIIVTQPSGTVAAAQDRYEES